MDFKKILMGVSIVIIVYLVFTYFFTDSAKTDLLVMHDATVRKVFDSEDLAGGNTANYAYSFWAYINTWNYGYGKPKVIFRRKGESTETPLIEAILNETDNNLTFNLAYSDGTGGPNNKKLPCQVTNIPLQKWTNVIVTLNNKAVDIYLDGKLVKTCILPGVQTPKPDHKLYISDGDSTAEGGVGGTGFSGFLSKVRFYSRTINPREAYEIYKEGHGSGWLANLLGKYKLKFSFLKDNKEINSISM